MLANHMAQYHIFNMRIYTPSSYSWDGAITYTSLSDKLLILDMLANHMAQYHIFNMRIYTPSSYSWDGAITYTSLSDKL